MTAAPRVLRVVGPPGSGKTLLITSLVEALRSRGYRVATAVRREGLGGSAGSTVLVLSSGGRVTLEREVPLAGLRDVVRSIDPSADLLLAEGSEEAGYPAVELAPPGAGVQTTASDLLAVVAPAEIARAFERSGPGETVGLADLVEARLLGGEDTGRPMQQSDRAREVEAGVPATPPGRARSLLGQLKSAGVRSGARMRFRPGKKKGDRSS